ncbi:unnamed protein product [Ilex paraguariensis]|uniref:Uncharacterized protein n=1 Tax=Ilex paraguariensis TaxID=185542 RepID=A0ABC8RVT3_9AQUA
MEYEEKQESVSPMPVIPRLERLNRLLQLLEEKQNLSGSQFSNSGVRKMEEDRCKNLSTALEEVHYKGTLMERLEMLENRVLQLNLVMDEGNTSRSSSSTVLISKKFQRGSASPILTKQDEDEVVTLQKRLDPLLIHVSFRFEFEARHSFVSSSSTVLISEKFQRGSASPILTKQDEDEVVTLQKRLDPLLIHVSFRFEFEARHSFVSSSSTVLISEKFQRGSASPILTKQDEDEVVTLQKRLDPLLIHVSFRFEFEARHSFVPHSFVSSSSTVLISEKFQRGSASPILTKQDEDEVVTLQKRLDPLLIHVSFRFEFEARHSFVSSSSTVLISEKFQRGSASPILTKQDEDEVVTLQKRLDPLLIHVSFRFEFEARHSFVPHSFVSSSSTVLISEKFQRGSASPILTKQDEDEVVTLQKRLDPLLIHVSFRFEFEARHSFVPHSFVSSSSTVLISEKFQRGSASPILTKQDEDEVVTLQKRLDPLLIHVSFRFEFEARHSFVSSSSTVLISEKFQRGSASPILTKQDEDEVVTLQKRLDPLLIHVSFRFEFEARHSFVSSSSTVLISEKFQRGSASPILTKQDEDEVVTLQKRLDPLLIHEEASAEANLTKPKDNQKSRRQKGKANRKCLGWTRMGC